MRKRIATYGAACAVALVLVLGGGMRVLAADKVADTVYHNGHIYPITETAEQAKDVKNAITVDVVATLNGKIVFVGSTADAKGQGYLDAARVGKIVDLKGKTMLPGFVDGHGHFPGESNMDLYTPSLNCPPLGPVSNMADLVAVLKAKAESTAAGGWVQGSNYDDSMIAEKRHPTRDDLDKASTQHFIKATHSSGHMCSVNSKVLDELILPQGSVVDGVFTLKDGTKVVGVEIKDGRPTGFLLEMQAMGLFSVPGLSAEQSMRAIARGSQVYAAAGVTTADQGLTSAVPVPGFQPALQSGDLNVRVVLHPMVQPPNSPVMARMLKGLRWNVDATDIFKSAPGADSPLVGDDVTHFGDASYANLPENFLLLGAWKMISDGSNQGYSGYFKHHGYYDKGTNKPNDPMTGKPDPTPGNENDLLGLDGSINFTLPQIINYVDMLHRTGQALETHTNGSWASENYMTAIELAIASHPEIKDRRHTFIHDQMSERQITERQIGDYSKLDSTADMYRDLSGVFGQGDYTIAAANGTQYTPKSLREALGNGKLVNEQNLVSSYFINHTYFWGDRHEAIYMGPGRAHNQNPVGWAAAMGHYFTTHNDTPVTPISPLRSIQSSVTRISTTGQEINGTGHDLDAKINYPETKGGPEFTFWNFDQRINALQAIRANTITPAFQNHVDDIIGNIVPGKYADFIILDKNPLNVAEAAPTTLAGMRVATTIVGDKVVHGFLPDAKMFTAQVFSGFEQPTGVQVASVATHPITADQAEKNYGALPKGLKAYGTQSFTATLDSKSQGKSAIFRLDFIGNGATVNTFQLHKLLKTQTLPYTYEEKPIPATMGEDSGKWWIANIKTPTTPLGLSEELVKDQFYTVFFIIRDNDGQFDTNSEAGIITDPVTLATTATLPDNGGVTQDDDDGSSNGCSVTGGAPAYDLAILLLAFAGIAAVRTMRRRS